MREDPSRSTQVSSDDGYRSIFEAGEQAVFIHDMRTGEILDLNSRACEIHGYTRDEIMKLEVGDFSFGTPPFTQERAVELVQRARDGPQRFEWLARKKNGDPFWVRVVLKRARIADRDVILAFVDDISESKRNEKELAEKHRRLRAMFDVAMDPIVAMDLDGNISDFNLAAERCFGYRRDEAIGQPLAELIIPARHRRSHWAALRQRRESDAPQHLNRRFKISALRADGLEFPVEITITSVSGPASVHFIGYIRDLTRQQEMDEERSQLEEQLRKVQTMEALGHLTASVAADFNEILTEIGGHVSMARSRTRNDGNDVLSDHLQHASRATERARELMSQMLTFSRGQKGDTVAFELGPLIRDTVKGLRANFPADIDVQLDYDARAPIVDFNPVQAAQIIVDLCTNACDAMKDSGGTISIRLEPVSIATRACSSCHKRVEGAFVSLTVEDEGEGVDPDDLPRIFEPFFTTRRRRKGSGMGLAKVHGIVHEHGGHILVDTSAAGTVFRVLLPLSTENIRRARERDAELDAPVDEATPRHGRALVVDDDPQTLESTARLLQRWGLDVQTFLDPEEAQAWFAADNRKIDVSLLDQTMPGMSGAVLAAELLTHDPNLPIVICASHAEEQKARDAAPEAVLSVLTKPLDPGQLKMFIEAILDNPL